MKTTTLIFKISSIALVLFCCTSSNIDTSQSEPNQQFRQLLQDYRDLEHRIRQNQRVELVSSPRQEHLSRINELFSPRTRYTTEELQQFAQKAQFTYCAICAWACSGYRGESPIVAYTLAYRDSQLANMQGNIYYKAALFVNSNSRHNQRDFEKFGREANQQIASLESLVRQKIQEQSP